MLLDTILRSTVIVARISHWKWRETKLQPSRAWSGRHISCCLVSLHFLCDILAPITINFKSCGMTLYMNKSLISSFTAVQFQFVFYTPHRKRGRPSSKTPPCDPSIFSPASTSIHSSNRRQFNRHFTVPSVLCWAA